jgi:photosystem II stability/assembly factor-like uncharacterized protein
MKTELALLSIVLVGVPQSTLSAAQDPTPLPPLEWRSIGPDRGGRSIAVAGHAERPHEYYFGATGGGLWKTTDGGASWRPVTDGQIESASVGAVAVAPSDPDVVYVGMGEAQLRANVLQGDGVYRSADGGRSWTHLGLAETQTISRIRIDPTDPDRVYVAALGHPFGENSERGVFRTVDGGGTWEKVLYRDDRTGAVDLAVDPGDPSVLYATLWEVYRRPWKLWSGGEGSGLFRSVDGGSTWTELTRNPGLPRGALGKITVTVSGADSRRIWANVEADDGGLYRSDDAGETWTLVNDHRDLWQRAFYFQRIQADPVDRETVYVLNFTLLESTDGGLTFDEIPGTHADHHDLWIDPGDPARMINGNDGGGVVTVNGGQTWTGMQYPTAQIYRLATTADFPYHACGAQQDNTTVCVASEGGHLRNPRDPDGAWMYAVGGGESGYVAPHPTEPDIFYAGATNTLTRYDRTTGLAVDVQPYPRIVMGEPAREMPERWNWTYPIVIAPTDPGVLYVGSQHLWKTNDGGRTWDRISPDLTRADATTLGDSGGEIVKDQDGPEIYGTIYTIAPSPRDAGVIWTGSDDGLVHLSRDGGPSWNDVSPPTMPEHSRITLVEASPHDPAVAYVAAIRYELDDRAPYIWKTTDYGASWTAITEGIAPGDFVRVVREDPQRRGLLYAGSEHGAYVSFDDGRHWESLSLNLPVVPVTGLVVEDGDLVIATHGRSFWVLDDIETLRQIEPDLAASAFHLFEPATAIRRAGPAVVDYYVDKTGSRVYVEILDADGEPVLTLFEGTVGRAGVHRQRWNLRYPGATSFPGIVLEGGDPTRGPWAPPGRYGVRVAVDDAVQTRWFQVKKDPRLTDVTDADLVDQFDLAIRIRDAETAANEGVLLIRDLRGQVTSRIEGSPATSLREESDRFLEAIEAVERELYQVRNQSPKDKIAFPIKLNDRLTGLRSHLERGDAAPTQAYETVFAELSGELAVHMRALHRALTERLPKLNRELEKAGLAPVAVRRSSVVQR